MTATKKLIKLGQSAIQWKCGITSSVVAALMSALDGKRTLADAFPLRTAGPPMRELPGAFT